MIDYEYGLFVNGKYRNRKVSDIVLEDESYIWWIIETHEQKTHSDYSMRLVNYLVKFFTCD